MYKRIMSYILVFTMVLSSVLGVFPSYAANLDEENTTKKVEDLNDRNDTNILDDAKNEEIADKNINLQEENSNKTNEQNNVKLDESKKTIKRFSHRKNSRALVNNAVDDINIQENGKGSRFDMKITVHFSDRNGRINSGDKITLDFDAPDGIKFEPAINGSIPVEIDGKVVGNYSYSGNQLLVTFNENIEDFQNVNGKFYFTADIENNNKEQGTASIIVGDIKKDIIVEGRPTGSGGDGSDIDAIFRPNGKAGTKIVEEDSISWYMYLNEGKKYRENWEVKLYDNFNPKELELIKDSFQIALYHKSNPAEYFSLKEFESKGKGKIVFNEDGGFELTTRGEILSYTQVYISYKTKVLDKTISDYKNTAKLKYHNDDLIVSESSVKNWFAGIDITGAKEGELKIFKYFNEDGKKIPLENVEFKISKKDNPENNFIIKSDKDGIAFKDDLESGKYIVEEVKTPTGFLKIDKIFETEVFDTNDGKILEIENKKEIEKIDIPVEKSWIGKATDNVKVSLQSNKIKIEELTLSNDNNWKDSFKNLPKYDKNGKEIEYTIKEEKIDGYNTTITGDKENGFKITNTISGKVSIGVTKKWIGPKTNSVNILLLANGERVKEVQLDESNSWQYTFENLEKYQDGKEITYTVDEVNVDDNKYESKIIKDKDNNFDIINTNIEKINIPVEKKWIGKEANLVNIQLFADGKEIDNKILKESNDWKSTFENLPKYAINGNEIEYTVDEIELNEYTKSISGNKDTGFTITNKITGKTSVGVTKTWKGPKTEFIEVDLLANGKKVNSIILNEDNKWQYTFENLDMYKDGYEIDYTVKEQNLDLEKYTSDIKRKNNSFEIINTNTETINIPVNKIWKGPELESVKVKLFANGEDTNELLELTKNNWSSQFTDLKKYDNKGSKINYTIQEISNPGYNSYVNGDQNSGFTITNTIFEKISLNVSKHWEGPKMEYVELILLANGEKTDNILKLSSKNNWKSSFKNLDKYDSNGNEINYEIKEINLDENKYISKIEKKDKNNIEIKNINIEKINIPVEKKWVGESLDSIQVKLIANGKDTEKILTLDKNNWKGNFSNLEKFDKLGNEIDYKIEEIGVKGYNTVITGDKKTGFTITNTITGKISVGVTKSWFGPKTEEVKINLIADGEIVNNITLSEKNQWKYTFENLEEYKDGKKINYTVEEYNMDKDKYISEIKEISDNNFEIKNINIEKTKVSVEKKWKGKSLDLVQIKLIANGEDTDTILTLDETNWKGEFTNLDKYDSDGNEINYTVDEINSEGYKVNIIGDKDSGFIVTNTISGKTTVNISKIWEGPKMEFVDIRLLANGKSIDNIIRLDETNNWEGSFVDLEEYNSDGEEIEYSIEEINLDTNKFTNEITEKSDNNFQVKNINIEKINIPFEKKWVGKSQEKVEIKLITNGKETERIYLNQENNWKGEFKNLPKFDEYGIEIEYEIDELEVGGYEKVITGNMDEGFTVTNTQVVFPDEELTNDNNPPIKNSEKNKNPKKDKSNSKNINNSKENNSNKEKLPKTGVTGVGSLSIIGILTSLIGFYVFKKNKR